MSGEQFTAVICIVLLELALAGLFIWWHLRGKPWTPE